MPDPDGVPINRAVLNALRSAGMSISQVGTTRYLAMAADEEQAGMELAMVCRPERLDAVMEEVRRRRDVFKQAWQETPHPVPQCTPMTAALRSVQRDVTEGVLP